MATEYFSDQESSMAATSLPTPTETPFMTPQPSTSRRSSRHGTPSSFGDASQASPAPPPSDFTSDDPTNDENISSLDPRRFTPTLQANLVAEILNLRRELDSKHRVIEDLETHLHSTKEENEILNDKLSTSLRESRSAKRQIQQLETGTLSALEELAKERDQVKADNEQLKNKLEATQKKARSEGDASDRTQDLWQKDKESWENDKRSLERRLHVTETRLKVVLDELAAQQAALEDQNEGEIPGNKDAVNADELAFDEEDEDLDELDIDSDDYTEHENRARKLMEARASSVPDEKARKMLGIMIEERTTPTPSEPDRDQYSSLDNITLRDDILDTLQEPKRQESLETIVDPRAEPESQPRSEPKVEPRRVEYVDTGSDLAGNMRDTSMQTEPIRIDQRIAKLPPHLLPSAISSQPGTPTKEEKKVQPVLAKPFEEKGKSPLLPSTQELLKSMRSTSVQATQDKYPGNNDDGPLTREGTAGIRRPFRTSSLFAGFDGASSDEEAAGDEEGSSDDEEYRGHAVVVRAVKYGRMFGKPPTPVPEEKEPNSKRSSYEKRSSVEKRRSIEKRSSYERPAKVEKPARTGSLRKQPSVRRSALVQSGITAHDHRSPSPALGEASSSKTLAKPKPPPFPVPTRSSSRKVPLSKSEGSQSPTPRSGNMFSSRRSRQQQHARQDSLRKVRSAAVIRRDGRQRSKSPPLPQSSLTSPEDTNDVPPLPRDRVTSPYQAYASRHHGRQPSVVSTAVSTAVTNSNQSASSVQSVSVVDAIAATMVGEWLWKYVRGRRSFGVADAVTPEFGKDDGTGGSSVRHKRWVWISPYERAIMWSSKQPTSGTALLGKTGRKLQIQSVLDVKDDTPAPRGVGVQPIFNRSILILTPARALKFTAPSAERHYLWLTALSFLAHSSQAVPDLNQLPSAPSGESEQTTKRSTAALGRRPITNSVRLAKQNQVGAKGFTNRAEPIYEGQTSQSPVSEAASPPVIPRFHGRKRSLTSPRQAAIPPPIPGNPFTRSFSHNHAVHSSSAVPPPIPTGNYSSAASSVGMSEVYSPGGANIPPSVPSSIYNPSRRTSEASSSAATASGTRREFFDAAAGTVRMEAFVEPRLSQDSRFPGGGFPGLAPTFREKSAARQYRKNSQWSVKSGTTGSEVGSRAPSQASGKYSGEQGSDLFRGF
ncbi:hypothetical protein GTA08_BOTSDO10827 [Neofusicoccum parvum]|nr:hypothetical protein GTA08_BOTSDO10827 [Neofusicoccum parvum]